MNALDQIVLDALAGIYSSELIGIDFSRLSPARISDFLVARIQLDGTIGMLRDVGAILTVLFGITFVIAFVKLRSVSKQEESPQSVAPAEAPMGTMPVPDGPLAKPWQRILGNLDSPREADWKLAVMDADKLADSALASAGFAGAGIGERLTNTAPGQLASLDGLWWAHKVRNRVAHEMDYFLRYTEARQAIGYYEQALNELRAI
jgi:hypothetical protein